MLRFAGFLPNARLPSSLLDIFQSLLKMGRSFDVKRHFPKSKLELNQPATTISSKGQIAIPRPIRDRLNLKPGTEVALDVQGEHVIMKRLVSEFPDWHTMRGMFRGAGNLLDHGEVRPLGSPCSGGEKKQRDQDRHRGQTTPW